LSGGRAVDVVDADATANPATVILIRFKSTHPESGKPSP
jgi:hypothetical protein